MIILFGLAGSGKGTQGKALSEIFGWRWLSVGEAIRQTGAFKEYTDRGELVPDDKVIELMNKQIQKSEAEGFDIILDGYPRDVAQAEYLTTHMSDKLDGAIILEVPKDELYKRLSLRGRDDDQSEDSVNRRFEVFEQNIEHILPLLEAKNIPIEHIDGVGSVEEVTDRLVEIFEKLVPAATIQKDDVNGGEIEKSYGE